MLGLKRGAGFAGRENVVTEQITVSQVHHLRLTVTDVQRSREFYTGLLGPRIFGGVVMARGNLVLGLRPMAAAGDRFDPDRVGLDHLSFGVASRAELEQAAALFDEHGVTHGVIAPLEAFGIEVLSFEDPDGMQLELTAPVAQG